MILDFNCYIINESSVKKIKKELRGTLGSSNRERMRKVLRKNIVTFKFRKRNGDLRMAHGTLHPSYLPVLKGGSPRPEHQVVYYDLDKEGWRSFRSFKFIKIIDLKPIGSKPTTKPSVKSSKPTTKPVPHKSSKPEHEDEDIKKTKLISEPEEKEIEKENKVHSEDVGKKIDHKVEKKKGEDDELDKNEKKHEKKHKEKDED